MKDVLIIGAGPAGLLAAWLARRHGAKVRVLASGIGTTHVSPGWIQVRNEAPGASLESSVAAHPAHPYALAGLDALDGGLAALREVCGRAGFSYVSDKPQDGFEQVGANFRLPTALGAIVEAAVVPESFAAGDLRRPGAVLIAGPAGWRDFYPKLCAENLTRQGFPARAATFDLPEMHTSHFDATPVGWRGSSNGRTSTSRSPRNSSPSWTAPPRRLSRGARPGAQRRGVARPERPPGRTGVRDPHPAAERAGDAAVQHVQGQPDPGRRADPARHDRGAQASSRAAGRPASSCPNVVRDRTYRADTFILATGGLYGGGIASDYTGALREAVFGLPLQAPAGSLDDWFAPQFLGPSRPSDPPGRRPRQRADAAGGRVRPRYPGECPHRRPAAGGL